VDADPYGNKEAKVAKKSILEKRVVACPDEENQQNPQYEYLLQFAINQTLPNDAIKRLLLKQIGPVMEKRSSALFQIFVKGNCQLTMYHS
jgi:hypothetical protein